MTGIGARLLQLEQSRARPGATKEDVRAFWEEHLALLSDAQLDRFEQIFLKYATGTPSEDDRRFQK